MSKITNVTRANKLNGTSHLSASISNTHTQVAASGRCRFAELRHNEIPKTIGRRYCLSNFSRKFLFARIRTEHGKGWLVRRGGGGWAALPRALYRGRNGRYSPIYFSFPAAPRRNARANERKPCLLFEPSRMLHCLCCLSETDSLGWWSGLRGVAWGDRCEAAGPNDGRQQRQPQNQQMGTRKEREEKLNSTLLMR